MNSPVLRSRLRKIITFFVMVLPIAIVIFLFYKLMPMIEPWLSGWSIALVALALAALLVWMLQFVLTRAPRLLNRIIPLVNYNPNRVLREFSIGISNITDPSMLATISTGLISEAIEIQRGALFEVDHETSPAPGTFRLSNAGGMAQIAEDSQTGMLRADSPIAQFFKNERRPITARELLHSAHFAAAPAEEREWFASLDMALFTPVHTKQDWIGLLALGVKTSGGSYLEDDLTMIGTLADQLSLSLQNARLIASLMRVNNDFRRAYTSMEQSNRQLQQAISQLEKMDETKSDFISVASHELRTPLTVMRGYTEMLVDDPALKTNAMHQKMLKGIYAGILRLHEIVESMLDVASIDSRSLSLHKQQISLNYTIGNICSSLKNALEERRLELVQENLRDLPAIEADSEALSKVFYQLLINAIKYTPDGGRITISGVTVSPGQLGLLEGGIEIIFTDTGIGIDPSNQELIFRKFYQTGKVSLHSTGKTKFKGSGPGLGLAIAKGIVDAHNGRIWAESKGHNEETMPGSQFHVILPYH